MASGFLQNIPGNSVRRLQQIALLNAAPGATDPLLSGRELQQLACLQRRASRNYFRLLEAERELRARVHSAPQTFGARLADSLEAERQRLGRELHTGVGQALASIQVHAGLLEDALPDPPEPVRERLGRIRALADTALDQVRGVSRRLYVPDWQALGLAQALRSLWEASGIPERFAAALDLRELSREPEPGVRRAIYLVAQEGISNVIQHADARRVRMSLGEEGGRITLQVADDGSGFRGAEASGTAAPAGIGLRSVRDLARELGGDLEAQSTPEGAQLTLSFPVTND